uniref:Uncharacterized protein n=1 Tax=Anguilla anguilla TaxID=7936 RepID=A0A0E9U7T0_ANGAN
MWCCCCVNNLVSPLCVAVHFLLFWCQQGLYAKVNRAHCYSHHGQCVKRSM